MQDLVEQIVALEWEDFQKVNNAGGRASCQDDWRTFEINRKSQFLTWSGEALQSYLEDLRTAQARGRNLLTEKYARMMAWTHPDEYRRLEPQLPPVPDDAKRLVDSIVYAQLGWQKDFAAAYPRLASRGRPVQAGEDGWVTSFETYLRGELLTYSVKTLGLYADNISRAKQQGLNLSLKSMEHMVRLSGFASMEEAESRS